MNISYRWVNGWEMDDADWNRIESVLAARGWMSLGRDTSRILMAEDAEGKLLGFHILQFCCHAEPLFVIPSARGSGIAEGLADRMLEFLVEMKARGWFVIADTPAAAKLCEERGMRKIESPVYVAV